MSDTVLLNKQAEFLGNELWSIVRHNLLRQTIATKHVTKGLEGVSCGCNGLFDDFRPLGVGVNHYEEHSTLEWPCKVDMDSCPRGVRP